MTFITILGTRDVNIHLFTKNGFFKFNRHRILQIIPALWRIRIASTAATATKKHIENIAEAAHILTAKTAATAHALIRVDMAVLIVNATFLLIAEYVISFFDFFKFFFRIRGFIHIGMIFP